jgi:hypothetical protein
LQNKQNRFQRAHGDLKQTLARVEQTGDWLEQRYRWVDILRELRAALMRTEEVTKGRLGVDTGVWVESMNSFSPLGSGGLTGAYGMPGADAAAAGMSDRYGIRTGEVDEAFRRRYMVEDVTVGQPPAAPVDPNAPPADTVSNSNQVAIVSLKCLGVDVNQVNPGANSQIAYQLSEELKKSSLFEDAKLDPQIADGPTSGTFRFGINLTLKQPLPLAAPAQ